MAGSPRAVITADSGRGTSFLDGLKDYRIVLPPLPTGEGLKTMVVLHCDTAGRPYRIEDFRQPMKEAGVIEQVGGIGAYQMSHVWLVNFRSEEAKKKLLDIGHIVVKGKTCVVFDPERQEVRLKVHWCAFNVSNETLRRAFAEYGEVKEVSSDRWKTGGFENADSTTRVVRLVLREGVNLERIPHQLRIGNGTVLVVVPGRAPICLRCRNTGHIRRDCKVPKCSECHAFGHEEAECTKSYARAATRGTFGDNSELHMDEDEAEQAASNPVVESPTAAALSDEKEGAMPGTRESAPSTPKSATTSMDTNSPQDIPRPSEKSNEEPMESDPAAAKRRHDDVSAMSQEQRLRLLERQWGVGEGKKQRVTSGLRSSSLPRDDNPKT
nr:uncharacterized protein LOC126543335 [Dermacentor andersoni]